MASSQSRHRTVFLIPGKGELAIRMAEIDASDVCANAYVLNARYFVHVDGFDTANNHPIWGVFDMRTARRNDPHPGQWSINDPVRCFPSEDAAVVYAMALMGRK